jgi:hypothetical protein
VTPSIALNIVALDLHLSRPPQHVTQFTGISARYQASLTPDSAVDTDQIDIRLSVMAMWALPDQRGIIEKISSNHAL